MLKYKERLNIINEEDGGSGDVCVDVAPGGVVGMGNPEFPTNDSVGSGDKWVLGNMGNVKKFKKDKKNVNKKSEKIKSFNDFLEKSKEIQPK